MGRRFSDRGLQDTYDFYRNMGSPNPVEEARDALTKAFKRGYDNPQMKAGNAYIHGSMTYAACAAGIDCRRARDKVGPPPKVRRLLVATADMWWQGGHDPIYTAGERHLNLVNAVNHTENALIEALENPNGEYARKLYEELMQRRRAGKAAA
jgi:hypothetical protein